MTSGYLNDLNDAQRKAVEYLDGPMMIIAGAGSGKTRALTYKIAYIIDSGLDPFRILALTFTNKAASEMKERVMQLIGGTDAKNVWMGTFHSVCARLLRTFGSYLGYSSNFSIYDTDDSKALLKAIVKEMNLEPKIYNPSTILGRISSAKTNLITPEAYAANPEFILEDKKAKRGRFSEVFKTYNQRLFKAAAMDFDDLLFNMNVLLRDEPEVLYRLQQKFQYILVDEYQDTNYAQYLIVKKLAANDENLCVVGDDAQSIYGFRGANIENILQLENDYEDLKTFKLEQNYRSTKTIVNAANSVIGINKDQIHKEIWTENEEGSLIKLIKASTENEEGVFVANSIFETKMNNQLPNADFVILYRTNAQSRPLEEALRKLNIPYKIYGGLSFYKRKEVKDLMAYFRLVVNPSDEEALLRIINYPPRGIGKVTQDRLVVLANEIGLSLWDTLWQTGSMSSEFSSSTRAKIGEFANMIKRHQAMLHKKDAFELGRDIANAAGLLKLLAEDTTTDGLSRYRNIEELLNSLSEFTDTERHPEEDSSVDFRTLDEYMQNVSLLTDMDDDKDDEGDKVTLMTIHSAKGLEFPYVYVVGLEENLFPAMLSLGSRQELEEERRLFYVALTRAEKQATLSYARSRMRWGNFTLCEPSRFLSELDEKFIEKPLGAHNNISSKHRSTNTTTNSNLSKMKKVTGGMQGKVATDPAKLAIGMRVKHERFGTGTIKQLEGSPADAKATVAFDNAGEKKLLLRFARLEPSDI